MIGKFRTLGNALLAVLAVFAVSATAAQAEGEFVSESYPTTTTSTGVEKWSFAGVIWECTAHKQHEMAEGSTATQMTPTYSNCVGAGFKGATVTMNSCSFGLNVEAKLLEDVHRGSMDIGCPSGKKIVFAAGNLCKVEVDSQATLKKVEYTSNTEAAPKKSIDVLLGLEKVRYDIVQDGFGCALPGVEEREDGKVNSLLTATGKDAEGKAVGIWVK